MSNKAHEVRLTPVCHIEQSSPLSVLEINQALYLRTGAGVRALCAALDSHI